MKLTQLHRRGLRMALTKLNEDGPDDSAFGICYNLNCLFKQGKDYLDVYVFVAEHGATWPGRTGKLDDEGLSVHPILREYKDDESRVPLWEGTQLDQRRSLIRYLMTKVA